jgi:hypothetical protein
MKKREDPKPVPLSDEQVTKIVARMTEDHAKAKVYWQCVANAIAELNEAAATRRAA